MNYLFNFKYESIEIKSQYVSTWFCNNRIHNNHGPARVFYDEEEEWWLYGQCHREDGPAVIKPNGTVYWYLNDKQYSFNEWLKLVSLSNNKLIMLKLSYE